VQFWATLYFVCRSEGELSSGDSHWGYDWESCASSEEQQPGTSETLRLCHIQGQEDKRALTFAGVRYILIFSICRAYRPETSLIRQMLQHSVNKCIFSRRLKLSLPRSGSLKLSVKSVPKRRAGHRALPWTECALWTPYERLYRMADCTQKLHGDYKRRCRIVTNRI